MAGLLQPCRCAWWHADRAAVAAALLRRWSVIWRLISPLIHPDTRKLMALYSAKARGPRGPWDVGCCQVSTGAMLQ